MTPDAAARVVEHLPLVRAVVHRLAARSRHARRLFDELVSAGAVGLIEAAQRFEDGRGASFVTFAERRVHGAVLDELRKLGTYRRSRGQAAVNGQMWSVAFTGDIEGEARKGALVAAPHVDDPFVAARVEAALRGLPPRLERIVRMYHFDEIPMHAIGGVMFVNESRISQLYARALEQLRARLADLQEHTS